MAYDSFRYPDGGQQHSSEKREVEETSQGINGDRLPPYDLIVIGI